MVGVSASVNLPLHRKVHKFSFCTSSTGWPQKKGRKTVVVVVWSPEQSSSAGTRKDKSFLILMKQEMIGWQ